MIELATQVFVGLLIALSFAYVAIYVLGEDSNTGITGNGAVFSTMCVQALLILIVCGVMWILGV